MSDFLNNEEGRIVLATTYINALIKGGGAILTPSSLSGLDLGDSLKVGQGQFRGYRANTGKTTIVSLLTRVPSTKGMYELVHKRPVEAVEYELGTGFDSVHSFTIIKHRDSGLAIAFINPPASS